MGKTKNIKMSFIIKSFVLRVLDKGMKLPKSLRDALEPMMDELKKKGNQEVKLNYINDTFKKNL